MTVIEIAYVFEPALFAAIIVKLVGVTTLVGVPDNSPEEGFMESPDGNGGLTEKLVTNPPVTMGVLSVIAFARTYVAALPDEYPSKLGMISFTVMDRA